MSINGEMLPALQRSQFLVLRKLLHGVKIRSALMYDFRHSGQGTDRRRRVLNDEVLGRPDAAEATLVDGSPPSSRGSRRQKSRYAEAACMDAQPRITDIVPRRNGVLALAVVAGLAVIAGLEALYFYMPRLASMATDGRVAAFDLDSEGSLGAWYSSLLLLASSLMAALVWSLRRHRLDDYHGRYRIWSWAAVTWFVMSLDEACSLHEGFKEMMTHLTGQRLLGDGSVWWIMAYSLVLGAVGLRLLMEMRVCRSSTTTLVLTGICWVVAVLAQVEVVWPRSGARGVMVEEACEMAGFLLLLLSMTLHARFVIYEIEGKYTDAKPKRRRKLVKAESTEAEAASSDEPSATTTRTRERKLVTAPSAAISASAKSVVRPAATSTSMTLNKPGGQVLRADPPENPLSGRKLTKAERRAQRRLEKQSSDE
jgi:hypothetical protein